MITGAYDDFKRSTFIPTVVQQNNHMIQAGIYKSTAEKILCIDTALCKKDNMMFLGEKNTEVKSLEVDSVDIPFTFYNITARNNAMTISYAGNSINDIVLEPGYYTMSNLVSAINTSINGLGSGYHASDISLNINPITGKGVFTSSHSGSYTILFATKNDACIGQINGLGSVLGFTSSSAYVFNNMAALISENPASIKTVRHLYLAVNEYSQYNKNGFNVPSVVGRLDQNIIARISIPDLEFGQSIQASHGNGLLLSEVRHYDGGKTTLQRLKMTLYDSTGEIVDPGDYAVNFKIVV
jgi:hypothetical protein